MNLVGELLQLQDEKTPRIFYRCRWTATDFNQKATGVLLQAMINCDTLSTGFGDKAQTSEKAVHTPGRRPRTTLTGIFFEVLYRPLAYGSVTGLGMRAKAPSVGKRDRERSEVDWSLAVVQGSLRIWDVSRYS